MTIISQIDLRRLHGPARHQGDRPTCMAFALSDLNGHRNARPAQLSPEYLYREAAGLIPGWMSGGGLSVGPALQAVQVPGQALEAAAPYIAVEPTLPLTPNPSCSPLFPGSYQIQNPSMQVIDHAIRHDRSIGLVIRMTFEFIDVDSGDPQVPFSDRYLPGELHAVLAVGLGHDAATTERHVLIRNSWGREWGDGGHAWLPELYIVSHAVCAFGD